LPVYKILVDVYVHGHAYAQVHASLTLGIIASIINIVYLVHGLRERVGVNKRATHLGKLKDDLPVVLLFYDDHVRGQDNSNVCSPN